MTLEGARWTSAVNMLAIRCSCGREFEHRADRRRVACPACSRSEDLEALRAAYADERKTVVQPPSVQQPPPVAQPPPADVFRVFLAHPKDSDPVQIEAWCLAVVSGFDAWAQGAGRRLEVVTGEADFRARCEPAGLGWNEWVRDVVERIDWGTRRPVYDAFVATQPRVGRATAAIIECALSARRPVWLLPTGGRVVRVVHVDRADQKSGWECLCA